jgi:choline-glycine betaine transporter
MSRNMNRAAAEKSRKTRRRNSILWSIAAIAIIVGLLLFEQVALLYLVATLGVAVLLIIVAFSDLHGEPQDAAQAASVAAAPSIAVAPKAAPTTTFGSTRTRSSAKRRRR